MLNIYSIAEVSRSLLLCAYIALTQDLLDANSPTEPNAYGIPQYHLDGMHKQRLTSHRATTLFREYIKLDAYIKH